LPAGANRSLDFFQAGLDLSLQGEGVEDRVLQMLPSFAAWERLRDQFVQAQEPAWPEWPRRLPFQKEIRFDQLSWQPDNRLPD